MRIPRRVLACAGAIAWAGGMVGCDPSEAPPVADPGPAFLVLGRASTQPDGGDGGVALYVQSRGGNYVGIRTHGCTHALGPYSGVTSSCGQTAYYTSAPLYLTADPEDRSCVIEARLYSICDCSEAGIPYNYASGDSVFEWCDSTGALITTQFATLGPPPVDASADGSIGDGGDGGAGGDGPTDARSSTLDSSGDS